MEYKGFKGEYSWDDESRNYHGEAVVPDECVITFQSETLEGLRKEFEESIDDYLSWTQGLEHNIRKP